MKTSTTQFELMVTFMEQHGDLSKPTNNAKGRITTIKKWEELTSILNSDGSGDSKTSDKWKKVWSDYKNNIKKKAAKIHRAVRGTGGGPALKIKLSDIEERVLNLIGVQAATGLLIAETGMPQRIPEPRVEIRPSPPAPPPPPPEQYQVMENEDYSWNAPGPSTRSHIAAPVATLAVRPSPEPMVASPPTFVVVEIASTPIDSQTQPEATTEVRPATSPPYILGDNIRDSDMVTPTISPHTNVARPLLPALAGRTPPRRNRQTRARGSPRRRARPQPQAEQTAEEFLNADSEWRAFRRSQHNDYMEMRREAIRIREMEVQTQRDWQELGSRVIDILEKAVNKYC